MTADRSMSPATSRSTDLAQPNIDATAQVHSFSNIIGDVHIGANVLVAPGTSIRADEGSPFHVGDGSSLRTGVVIQGLEQGRVVGDDQQQYSVWVGKNTSIAHMALIHGPAYVGDDCFIGFRSTVFNARIGKGCVVMMHVLIQDVEISPGRYVPSGSIITTQQQADRLADVQAVDVQFAAGVVGGDGLRGSQQDDIACIATIRNELEQVYELNKADDASRPESSNHYSQGQSNSMSSDVVEQVRQLLAQGYRIGTEHADKRRFQTSSWQTCTPIQATRESDAVAELHRCLAEHSGEYVRLFGIDTQSKRRVSELIVQRPGDQPSNSPSSVSSSPSYSNSSSSYGASLGGQGLNQDSIAQVRQLLAQGYRIGMEHADKRRFQTSSWQSCTPIQSTRESDVIAALEACLSEHSGEYVRIFGIDTQSKRRIAETTVQRPGDKSNGGADRASYNPAAGASSHSYSAPAASSGSLSSGSLSKEAIDQIRQTLAQGHRIGMEHADKRRFQTSSWQSCAPLESNREADVIAGLEACLSEHQGEYVRLISIDTQSKRRVSELIVQRP